MFKCIWKTLCIAVLVIHNLFSDSQFIQSLTDCPVCIRPNARHRDRIVNKISYRFSSGGKTNIK